MNRYWVCVDASVIVKLVIDVREDMPLFGLWRAWLPAAYDAHYLALAERLDAEFWTADRRLFQAASGTPLSVHLVEDKP